MAPKAGVMEARRLLDVRRRRAVVRHVCAGCEQTWPCLDTVYASAVTGTKPEPQP
jgi:hypothetical protein